MLSFVAKKWKNIGNVLIGKKYNYLMNIKLKIGNKIRFRNVKIRIGQPFY